MLEARSRIEDWLSDEFITGSIAQVRPNVGLLRTASEALHRRLPKGSLRLPRSEVVAYAHAISSGRMSRRIYGSPSCSLKYPRELLVPGTGVGIHAAFLPINESMRSALLAGRWPRRGIDDSGRPAKPTVGRSLGSLFLPPVDLDQLRAGHVRVATWSGGFLALDLPPRILETLAPPRSEPP